MGLAFAMLVGIAIPGVVAGDRGIDPRPRAGKVADGALDLSA
jgi:hypothetical protein